MKRRICLQGWVVFFSSLALWVGVANAELGTSFWAMHVGNSWNYTGGNPGSPGEWSYRTEITGPDTTTIPGIETFVAREYENEIAWERNWFSINLSEMRLWRMELYEDVANPPFWINVTIDGGAVVARNPLIVGDQWTEIKSGTYNGTPLAITMNTTVQNQGLVAVPRGTYLAYKLRLDFNEGAFVRERWFVPYLGFIRRQDGTSPDVDIEELTFLNVKKGTFDADADCKADLAIYRKAWGAWYIQPSAGGTPVATGWGGDPTDIPVPGDYDGDGKADVAIYRASTGAWWIIPSATGTPYGIGHGGGPTDIPVPGDYDGDGKTDIAIYRKAWGAWYIQPSAGGTPLAMGWGGDPTDLPVPGDYDGDGKTDVAIYRAGSGAWWIIPSTTGTPYGVGHGGGPTDVPVPGDYDGDGKTDIAIYREAWGAWYIRPSAGGMVIATGWGGDPSDIPVPADYDGDGKTDVAIYRAENGAWWIIPSSTGTSYGVGFGGGLTDIPLTQNLSSLGMN